METTDIRGIRLYNQLLAGNSFNKPEEVVYYMGAMQAQAFDMAKWAIGVRLPGSVNADIDEAINGFRIVRTHVLRPTWHFVAAEDVHWMLELTAPRLKPIYLNYGKYWQVEESFIHANFPKLIKLFEEEPHLTRQDIIERFPSTDAGMNSHIINQLLAHGELEGIIGSGIVTNNKHTYCLLQDRIPKPAPITKEDALERLARRYFTSHGPATIQDYIWWSGLTATDAKKGLNLIKEDFISEEINGRTFWMKSGIKLPAPCTLSPVPLLLPPFDEYVVSYKDRSEIIDDRHYAKVMTKNGLFSPTIMLGGEIIGSWKKAARTKAARNKARGAGVELSFFNKTTKQTQQLYEAPAQAVKDFYNS